MFHSPFLESAQKESQQPGVRDVLQIILSVELVRLSHWFRPCVLHHATTPLPFLNGNKKAFRLQTIFSDLKYNVQKKYGRFERALRPTKNSIVVTYPWLVAIVTFEQTGAFLWTLVWTSFPQRSCWFLLSYSPAVINTVVTSGTSEIGVTVYRMIHVRTRIYFSWLKGLTDHDTTGWRKVVVKVKVTCHSQKSRAPPSACVKRNFPLPTFVLTGTQGVFNHPIEPWSWLW